MSPLQEEDGAPGGGGVVDDDAVRMSLAMEKVGKEPSEEPEGAEMQEVVHQPEVEEQWGQDEQEQAQQQPARSNINGRTGTQRRPVAVTPSRSGRERRKNSFATPKRVKRKV